MSPEGKSQGNAYPLRYGREEDLELCVHEQSSARAPAVVGNKPLVQFLDAAIHSSFLEKTD